MGHLEGNFTPVLYKDARFLKVNQAHHWFQLCCFTYNLLFVVRVYALLYVINLGVM